MMKKRSSTRGGHRRHHAVLRCLTNYWTDNSNC